MKMIQNRLEIQPSKVNEFQKALKYHLKWTCENEPGCCRFDIVKDENCDNIFHLYELYVNQDALAIHAGSPTLAQLRAKFPDWVINHDRFTGDLILDLEHL